MIRKFNYTGRKKIKRGNVHVDILRDTEGIRFFNASVSLDDINLPSGASVYFEAYHRVAYRRFDFGTVGERRVPEDRYLKNIPESVVPLFRVKVVDRTAAHGRILAAVDKIRPESIDRQPSGSQSLLYVEYGDLGQRIWELDLDGDWPVLRLNRQAADIGLVASGDDRFMALVYPEILRQILFRIIVTDEHTDPDCDDDWPSLWLKHACNLTGSPEPPSGDEEDRKEWIEKAVNAFCESNMIMERFNKAFQGSR
ncbi:MAG: hypothetical protein EHM85_01540 [Desulfobacteraceae bacterium]|nr:MAG: hypothetical protein EHM85_01540 [Desulfobacteraceae bacterium]